MFRQVMFACLCFLPAAALAAPHTLELSIETMACGPDPHNIRAALEAVKGVTSVTISLENKMATITFDDEKLSVDQLLAAVATTGHAALPQSKPPLTQ